MQQSMAWIILYKRWRLMSDNNDNCLGTRTQVRNMNYDRLQRTASFLFNIILILYTSVCGDMGNPIYLQ